MKPPVLYFTFSAADGEHVCRVEFDWLGSERYYVDNQIVLRRWSMFGGTAKFAASGAEIQVRSMFKGRSPVTEVLVNGKTVVENLLSTYNQEMNTRLRAWLSKLEHSSAKPVTSRYRLAKVVIWLVLACAFFALFKWLARIAA